MTSDPPREAPPVEDRLHRAQIGVRSELPAPPDVVWRRIASPEGINAELMPIASLAFPKGWRGLEADCVTRDIPLFTTSLLLFGIFPIDRHSFGFVQVEPGRGFLEHSSSRMYRDWIHERVLEPVAAGTAVVDRVHVRSRLPGLDRLAVPILRLVFRHRHRRLRTHFSA